MNFRRERSRNYYLDDTSIPNVFIAEYVPGAPGDYIKVYLYAYMQSELGHIISNESLAQGIDLDIEVVLAAWNYFEKRKAIRKYYPDPKDKLRFDVEFIDLKNSIFGKEATNAARPATPLDDKNIAELFNEIENITEKELSGNSVTKIGQLIKDHGADTGMIAYAFRYCKSNKKTVSIPYVQTIVKDWLDKGINSAEAAAAFTEHNDARFSEYKEIARALGLYGSSLTDEEKREFDRWLDKLGFTLAEIIEISKKSAGKGGKYNYTKAVIESEYEKSGKQGGPTKQGTISKGKRTRDQFYEERRLRAETESDERRAAVYEKIAEMPTLEEEIKSLNIDLIGAMTSQAPNRKQTAERIRKTLKEAYAKKELLLDQSGFSGDYMDIRYTCPRCKDTGQLENGSSCDCYPV